MFSVYLYGRVLFQPRQTDNPIEGAGNDHNKVISGFRASVRPGRRWQGSSSRQKGPCTSQGGLASHRATDAPIWQ
ncbi:hypothetical protein PoB_003625600 [Plakobranchus ocellatus]|uniref:Uncharacterized protein n=1 Tax=Plakobranchus ocellatus TaxID=259542 RepID=A0AAV4AT51_9GAST|nr:hypothetical protein PoB_003625600 [Plakobranchus ocellatus]